MGHCNRSYKMFRYMASIILSTIKPEGMNSRWVKSESILDKSNYNNNNTVSNDRGAQLPKPGGPLKPRLDAVQKRIKVQIGRLEELHNMLMLKDNELFQKLMASIKENDAQHCTILSSELTNSRHVSRVVLSSLVALEKLITKLSSASSFGDLVIILGPAMAIVKNLRSSLTPYMPEMEEELGVVSELLSGILVDAGQVGGYTINFAAANEEAVSHIEEASLVVDQKIKEDLPGIPELPIVSLKFF
jgi:division protein CdvB (Snf7/Vps24/ESCRT-III family)